MCPSSTSTIPPSAMRYSTIPALVLGTSATVIGVTARSRHGSTGRAMETITPRLLSWASILEDSTREQALRAAEMPFIHPHLALMPDAHLGLGATVGSVIPTDGAIIPAAVGVDIGCGMMAVRTQFTADDLAGKNLAVLHEHISRS